jgi:transposase
MLVARHSDWVVGFLDETWWSRFEQPSLSSWIAGNQRLHLVERLPKVKEEQKALACYGLLVRFCPETAGKWQEETWLRFCEGHPISALSLSFLEWSCAKLQSLGKRVWVLVWDNASWHISRTVREWIREHNRQVKETGRGVRIWVCRLPTQSPWLNPIEPKWAHGKRRVVEPNGPLSPQELEKRVYQALDCLPEPHLALSKNVV